MSDSLPTLLDNLSTASRRKHLLLLAAILKLDLAMATESWAPTSECRGWTGSGRIDPFIFLWETTQQLAQAAEHSRDASERALLRRLWNELKELAVQEQDFEAAALIRDQQDWIRHETTTWLTRKRDW